MQRWTELTLLGLIAVSACAINGCGESAPATTRPNIVVILIDTQRADRLGCLGAQRPNTPFLDRLAAEGIVFENALTSCSWTLPAVASLFTGLYPSVHKASMAERDATEQAFGRAPAQRVLSNQHTTLAEALQKAGYQTAAFVTNRFIQPKFGFGQGFDYYDEKSFPITNQTPGSEINKAALQWLKGRDARKPFFLYLHYMDVHDPYRSRAEFIEPLVREVAAMRDKRQLTQLERVDRHRVMFEFMLRHYTPPAHQPLIQFAEYWQARYDAGVRELDQQLADLQAELAKAGLWEQTFVVVVADHGEALGEHQWWGHGWNMHHNQIHIPLIMRYPGKLPASKRVGEMARIIDVMPTMLDVLQLPATGAQGSSLLPLLSGSKRDVLSLAEVIKGNEKNNPNQRALYEGDWKLLETEQPLGYQLFRYREDPGELNDLAAKHPDVVEAMRAKLGSLSQQNAALAEKIATRTHEYDAADLRNLGALGYIDDGDDDEPESQPATQPASRPAATAPSRPTAP